jgi:outer membrane protein assembly factor BamE (lipoprotein component of BamABCDE complex)
MQKSSFSTRRILLNAVICLTALTSLSGCIIPYHSHKVYEGAEIEMKNLTWLHVGETTRDQVLEKLGPPYIDFVDRHVIAYAWSGQSGEAVFVTKYATGTPIRMRRAFLVRFDSGNRVAAFSTVTRQTEVIPYDVRAVSFDAEYDDWRKIIDDWLKQPMKHTEPGGAKPQ